MNKHIRAACLMKAVEPWLCGMSALLCRGGGGLRPGMGRGSQARTQGARVCSQDMCPGFPLLPNTGKLPWELLRALSVTGGASALSCFQ